MFEPIHRPRGLVLGKFMPPHQGHCFLVNFARFYAQELVIVVGSMPTEPIPGSLRFQWMQELFPDCQVVHLDKVLPQYPHEDPHFWELWRTSLEAVVPGAIDLVFASEDYGSRLAQELKAQFLPLDIQRQSIPISGTAIRENPLQNWDYLPACVRPYFLKRIAVLGPESSGKSTLAKDLARQYHSLAVPEYAEILLREQAGQLCEADMPRIAQGQWALEEALARQAQKVLFCDTDLLSTCLWWEELYGYTPPDLETRAKAQTYALTLLCKPDLTWHDDIHRLRPKTRLRFFERCQRKLEAWKRPYVVIEGQGKQRINHAMKALSDRVGL